MAPLSGSYLASRKEQTTAELARLKKTTAAWQADRRRKDTTAAGYRGQYESQLVAIGNLVDQAVADLEAELGVAHDEPAGDYFARCARIDRAISWTWHFFGYFREKFDQRDDAEMGPILRMADEVVWSCYRPFFADSKLAQAPPAPLPCVVDEMSPAAIREDRVPDDLKGAGPLQDFVDRLPVPILKLPRSVVSAPWLVTLIGHETGHFIQPQVAPDYVRQFRLEIEAAVAAAGGKPEDAARWGTWAPEIFADWYSVLTMGPWALWALAQVELMEKPKMTQMRFGYPPPLVRLALVARLADAATGTREASALLESMDLNPPPGGSGALPDLDWVDALPGKIRACAPAGTRSLGLGTGEEKVDGQTLSLAKMALYLADQTGANNDSGGHETGPPD